MMSQLMVMMTTILGLSFLPLICQAQAVGGSGKGGGGLMMVNSFEASPGKCIEGRRNLTSIPDPAHPGYTTDVWRTCINGTYMTPEEKAKYIYNPKIRCKEGRLETWSETNGGDMNWTKMVCRKGRWIPYDE